MPFLRRHAALPALITALCLAPFSLAQSSISDLNSQLTAAKQQLAAPALSPAQRLDLITRCDELQQLFKEIGRAGSFGASTTHMSKLLPRIHGGGGGGCPLLVFGITRKLYEEN